jgi:hypothetical protein
MRSALGAPLQNISDNILNRVISKNIQADLKKYKMGKKESRGASNNRERSPIKRAAYIPDEEPLDTQSLGDLSKEVTHYLSSINTSH